MRAPIQTDGPAQPPADLDRVLATSVALYDVVDVEGFVNATLNAFERGDRPEWARLRGPERDELVLEGIAIMYELADRFEPRRGEHDRDGWFSGFAAFYLPKKLGEAWHRLNEHHRYVTQPDGKRKWIYLDPAHSLDGLREGSGGADGAEDLVDARILPPEHWTKPLQAA